MGILYDLSQKVKGIFQQSQGEVQREESGLKGGYTEMKGKANETIADMKLKRRIEIDEDKGI